MQGGCGFPAFHPLVYEYIVTGSYLNLEVPVKEVPEAGVRYIIEQVCSNDYCSDTAVNHYV